MAGAAEVLLVQPTTRKSYSPAELSRPLLNDERRDHAARKKLWACGQIGNQVLTDAPAFAVAAGPSQ